MTALDFVAAGGAFERDARGHLLALQPRGADLAEKLRAEVDRRVPRLFGEHLPSPRAGLPRAGECDCCGDPLEPHRGGMCSFCVLARGKALGGRAAPSETPSESLVNTAERRPSFDPPAPSRVRRAPRIEAA